MHLHLVVPYLFWPRSDEGDIYGALRLPGLELLLARGRRSVSDLGGYERWIAAQFGLAGDDPPVAPYRMIGDGVDPGQSAWLCADPISLQAGMDRVALADAAALELDAAEAAALVESLNLHFGAEGIRFLVPHPSRWYTQLGAEEVVTTALVSALGLLSDGALPRGAAGPRWRTRMTEAQMVMHEHAVNQAREARGAPPVNGIWIWGGGARRTLTPRRAERWYAEDPLTRGLAQAADAMTGALPEALRREDLAREGVRWYVLPAAARAVGRGDVQNWRGALAALEADWFAPLAALLRRGDIGMASIHAVSPQATLSVEATRSDLRHLWRRPRAIAGYLSAQT